MDEKSQFMLDDAKRAHELTCHIDDLRGNVTSFFLSFAGAGAIAVSILAKGEAKAAATLYQQLLPMFLALVGVLGVFVVCVLARLRRVQLEHFRIIAKIRGLVLKDDIDAWNAVELSRKTLPVPTRKSGTYFWVIQVVIVTGVSFAFAVFLALTNWTCPTCSPPKFWPVLTLVVAVFVIERLYLRLAQPPADPKYNKPPLFVDESMVGPAQAVKVESAPNQV